MAHDPSSLAEAMELLRQHDRDRFLASLLFPAEYREDVAILYAFNAEISRIRDVVSEAIPGEIRLQWWRDAIKEKSADARANPLAALLLDVIEKHDLSGETFDKILLARAFDLYHDPMPSMADFETYAGETTSLLFQLSARIASSEQQSALADAAGHAGVAYALMVTLRNIGADARRGQVFLPNDQLALFGTARDDLTEGKMSPALREAITHFANLARDHRDKALNAARLLPRDVKPVFLPIVLIEPYLKLIEKNLDTLLDKPIQLSQLKAQWALWRGGI